MSDVSTATNQRLVGLTLDENSLGRGSPDQEHERAVAVYDLIERNSFAVPERAPEQVLEVQDRRATRLHAYRISEGDKTCQ